MRATSRSRSWLRRILLAVLVLLLVFVVAAVVWSRTGIMAAEPAALRAVQEDLAVTLEEHDDAVVLRPADGTPHSSRGLVFYPGAKVEAEAYASRLSGLVSREGLTVVVPKPWLHLALFDRRDLDTFTALAPDTREWLVGGHSMGGVRACQLAPRSTGLLLLGSYCATDLSSSALPVLSIGGERDGLSTPAKIADARDELPANAVLVEVPGANHASFGDYGVQAGDGTAAIPDREMTERVTQEVSRVLLEPTE